MNKIEYHFKHNWFIEFFFLQYYIANTEYIFQPNEAIVNSMPDCNWCYYINIKIITLLQWSDFLLFMAVLFLKSNGYLIKNHLSDVDCKEWGHPLQL